MDVFSRSKRSALMARIKSQDTSAELAVRRLVFGMGFRYRLHVSKLPGKPDLVFSRFKKVIEVRGCFWHQHGKCIDSHLPKSRQDYWMPKLRRNVERDKANVAELRSLGWTVLILWECEIRDIGDLANRIRNFLAD